MPAVFGDIQARLLGMGREISGTHDQIHFRHWLVSLPESYAVIDHVNSSGALGNLIGSKQFAQMPPNLRRIEREGKPNSSGVLFKPAPVAFVCKGLALKNPHRCEQAPAIKQSGLAR